MNPRIKSGWLWFCQTSTVVGMPVTIVLVAILVQKMVFTTTCQLAGWRCEYSLGAQVQAQPQVDPQSAMVEFMGGLLQGNPGMDIVTKPTEKSKK